MTSKRAVVVGAGIGGLTAGIALRRAGFDVEVLEQAAELRAEGTGLSVMSNAVAALRAIGIDGELEARGRAIASFDIRTEDGRSIATLPIAEVSASLGAPSVCIHRGELLGALRDALDANIRFSSKCRRVVPMADGARVELEDGTEREADLVVGADGFYSATRSAVAPDGAARPAGYVCYLATTPFTHPRLPPGHVAHYWGRGLRFGLIDIGHGQAYWWGTRNHPEPRRALEATKAEIAHVYAGWAPEIREVIDRTEESAIVRVEAMDRAPIPRWSDGRLVLIGDAAHPMLTSLGQGAGQAIEDAVVLGHACRAHEDTDRAIERYERMRRPRALRIAELSRTVSWIEQLEHPLAVGARNLYVRLLPRRISMAQNRSILTFPELGAR